jgi:hypothetical protein
MYPSVLAHILSGGLMFLALYIAVTSFKALRALDTYRMLALLLAFSTAVGVHGVSHLGLERTYGYSPLNMLH